MIKCPQCGADNPEKSNFCRSCGENLKFNHKLCPGCGQENSKNAKFCVGCGLSFEKQDVDLNNQNNLKRSNSESNPDKLQDTSDAMVVLDLTPAESRMILGQEYTKLSDLLKVTFIDLIFKNVYRIEVQEVEKRGIFGSKMVKEIYLEEGKNFNMPLKPHEEVFRDLLPAKADSKRLKKLQKLVFKKHRYYYAEKKLYEPLTSQGYFNKEKMFIGKKYVLSDKGEETRQMILELKEEGKHLEDWIENDPERAKAYLQISGPNVFLTDDYYFEWFKNNSKKISKLFVGVAVGVMAYKFSHVRWYSAFGYHDIDLEEFNDFDGDIGDNFDIFSDSDAFGAFDSMDFADFDAAFDSGGFDGGFDGGDGGDGGGGE